MALMGIAQIELIGYMGQVQVQVMVDVILTKKKERKKKKEVIVDVTLSNVT